MKSKEIYTVPNPYFLSDKFIYYKHKDLGTVYIKINYCNKIEEIGIDITKRMHNLSLDQIKNLWEHKESTKKEKQLIESIGDEYWYHLNKLNKLK